MEQLGTSPFTVPEQVEALLGDIGHVRNYGRNFKFFILAFYFVSHLTFAVLPGEHDLFRYLGYNFYYLSFGQAHFRVVELLYSMIVLPLFFWVYQFYRHEDVYTRYGHYIIKQYNQAVFTNKGIMRARFINLTSRLISWSREFQIYHTVIFFVLRVDILRSAQLELWQWPLVFCCLVLNFVMHLLGTRLFVNMYVSILVHLILFDGPMRDKLNQMNRKIADQHNRATSKYRQAIRVLKSLEHYGAHFGSLFSVFLYLMMPVVGASLLELARVQTWIDSLLLLFGFSTGFFSGIIPMLLFGFYTYRFQQQYHRLNRYHCRNVSERLRMLRLVELVGGPPVGVRYYKLDQVITHRSLTTVSFQSKGVGLD